MTALAAVDLDGTLIYSRSALRRDGQSPPLVCVEVHEGVDVAFMTAAAAARLRVLATEATVVPVSARSPLQLARVRLPGASRYAIAANGGRLLVDGVPDPEWSTEVLRHVAGSAPFGEVRSHVAALERRGVVHRSRGIEDLFCYGVVDTGVVPSHPDAATALSHLVAEEVLWSEQLGWRVSVQGRKVYWVPEALDKGRAVQELAARIGAAVVVAAGDSALDAGMLECADEAIRPAHGELADAGWARPHVSVTRATGVRAGEEVVDWLVERVASAHCGAPTTPPQQQQHDRNDGRGDDEPPSRVAAG